MITADPLTLERFSYRKNEIVLSLVAEEGFLVLLFKNLYLCLLLQR